MTTELFTTIIARPYVFAFLAAFLFLGIMKWGWKKTLLWLVSGYCIAWASEFSSIHNGFPYGEYHYVYENLKGELLIAGVPFFDSLSYPFLVFASFTTAEFILNGFDISRSRYLTISRVFLGALLTMLIDVITDPIATIGDKWFLGLIHYYAHPGFYFGVPMTNFAGWFLVALAIITFNVLIWNLFFNRPSETHNVQRTTLNEFLYPLFYISIALFSISMSFWVGAWEMGLSSSVILAVIISFIIRAHRKSSALQ